VIARLIASWACNVAALFVADALIDGITFDDAWKVVIAGAVFGVVNFIVKPIVTLLSLPVIILTLGIALFFVNLLMLALTALLVSGFDIDGFWAAVGGTIVVWAVNAVLNAVFGVDDMRARRRRAREAR
jgi:putative membrane protein